MTPRLEGEMQGSGPPGPGQSDPREPTSLQALLDRWGSLPLGAALVLFDDLLEVLEQDRAEGGAGGELTPAAVLVDEGGAVGVGDAGRYRAAGTASHAYTAPEMRGGASPTKASDIYTVSALFFEAATGLPPQAATAGDGSATAVALETPLPEAVIGVARQGLAPEPSARPSAGLLRARLGTAGDAALHEWQSRGRTWLSSAVAALRPQPDIVPPRIDWSSYGPRPGAEAESPGFLGLSFRPRVVSGLGIAITGLLMTIIGTCNLGTPPPQTAVSAATQPAAVTTPAPASTTNPGFVVPSEPPAPASGEATPSAAPATTPAPTPAPTALPTADPNVFTPFPLPTDYPSPTPPPTPTPSSCFLLC